MADKKEKATKKATKEDAKQKATLPPSGFKVAMHEIVRSKSALTALIIIIVILLFTFGGSLFLNRAQVTEMNIADSYYGWGEAGDRKSTRLNSSHVSISYAVFCLKKKKKVYK